MNLTKRKRARKKKEYTTYFYNVWYLNKNKEVTKDTWEVKAYNIASAKKVILEEIKRREATHVYLIKKLSFKQAKKWKWII